MCQKFVMDEEGKLWRRAPDQIRETDITTREAQDGPVVVYTMEPYIADELARVLQRESCLRDKIDKGWEEDAAALAEAVSGIEGEDGE